MLKVVGPRYIPGQPVQERLKTAGPVRISSTRWAVDTDQVPDSSKITPPVNLQGKNSIPVELTIDLAAEFPLSRLESMYHGIESKDLGKGHYSIRLTNDIKADRDFVLEWQAKDAVDTQAAHFAESLDSNQYMLLMLMPPQKAIEKPVPEK